MMDSFSGYDRWKTTPPDWDMPFHIAKAATETEWRMHKRRDSWFDGDESKYEYLCEEWDELARIDAHEREPDDEDFEQPELS